MIWCNVLTLHIQSSVQFRFLPHKASTSHFSGCVESDHDVRNEAQWPSTTQTLRITHNLNHYLKEDLLQVRTSWLYFGLTCWHSIQDFICADLVNAVPFARLPPELFDEIISYFPILPPTFYANTAPVPIPSLNHRQRTDVLRALSQSCRSLRQVAFPRLWRRLDVCFVPESSSGSWYQFCNANLKKKAEGVINSGHTLQNYIRCVCLQLGVRSRLNYP